MLILLADDERLIRLGLQSMIEELYPRKHAFIHARNGNEIVNILKKQTPDLAFLDIKMPLMNGLEALKICKELSTSTIWVILSGYANFEYAREALTLSTFDYLLKPVEMTTLAQLFERIEMRRKMNKQQINTQFSHDVIRSFNIADQFSPLETDFQPQAVSDYILYQFYIDYHNQTMQKRIKQKLCDNLASYCNNSISIVSHCLFFNTDGNLCLICDIPDASWLTHFIRMQAKELPDNAFSVFWGNRKTIRDIYEVSQRISRIANIRLVYNCSDPVFIKNAESLAALSSLLSFSRELISALNYYIIQNKVMFHQKISDLQQRTDFAHTFSIVDTSVLGNYLSGIFDYPICIRTFDELIDLLLSCEKHLKPYTSSSTIADITQIQNYVRQNFAKDVSISYVSELFNLSSSYLSKLFHEKTGQKYIDFVTQVRMEEAKKILLHTPTVSVKQAAELVGYSSVRHFSKNFQKYTGILPSNYCSNLSDLSQK